MEHSARTRVLRIGTALAFTVSAAITGLIGAPAASANEPPITIGFITSNTGLAASSYVNSQWGAQARIDAQNAIGGVHGHKLKLVVEDDGSSFSNNLTVAQDLVQSKGAFGVIEDTSFTAGSYRYLQQQGVPVTGAAIDGPEWNLPPNTNMFSVSGVLGPFSDGVQYTNTDSARFLKSLGITKMAVLAFNIPSAITAAKALVQTDKSLGIQNCYLNTSIPFGDSDFTAVALQIKSAGCNGVEGLFLLSSDIALSKAVKDAGVNAKMVWPTAYDQNLVDQPSALQSMKDEYTSVTVDTTVHPSPAAKLMLARLKKYTPFTGSIPSINIIYGYAAADLMITGLEMAGAHPTRQAFIKNLRKDDKWTAGGLFSQPDILSNFGTPAMVPKTACETFLEITSTGYAQYKNGKPICGDRVKIASS